ncbi:hypothetical protein [Nakamurella endophytica]|uniref:Uncharacterized protein n=1 Tax=Nakamurella endophytica TaxID=1748367 RepID=A0A917SL17_9ACTN|nr:hypothetical protein [Nakamurella endophytica]GGL87947.1 hypothetical protein GCM10011594_04470 [Nakamurella endophytica]
MTVLGLPLWSVVVMAVGGALLAHIVLPRDAVPGRSHGPLTVVVDLVLFLVLGAIAAYGFTVLSVQGGG